MKTNKVTTSRDARLLPSVNNIAVDEGTLFFPLSLNDMNQSETEQQEVAEQPESETNDSDNEEDFHGFESDVSLYEDTDVEDGVP